MGSRSEVFGPVSAYIAGYVHIEGVYYELYTIHSPKELHELIDWLGYSDRSDRVIVLLASMSPADRRMIVSRLEALGLRRRRRTRAQNRALRRQLSSRHPQWSIRMKQRALVIVVSAVTMPIWLPLVVGRRLIGRAPRRLSFSGCSALGLPGSGGSGGGRGGPGGLGGPDGGDRFPRRPRPGAGSLAVELDQPAARTVIEPRSDQ